LDFEAAKVTYSDGEPVRLKKPKKGWLRHPLLVALIVLAIGGVFASIHSTYAQCLADERQFIKDYTLYSYELFARKNDIREKILASQTDDDLRKRMSVPYHLYNELKDKSTAELQVRYEFMLRTMEINDASELGATVNKAHAAMKLSPGYDFYNSVFSGTVDNVTDEELPRLKQFAKLFPIAYLDYFLNPIRTDFDEGCTLTNTAFLEMGAHPIIVHANARSLTEGEKRRVEWFRTHPLPD
jgi:hypothetical protein